MTAYLGPAGNLVAFACPSDEQISREDSISLSRTLGGVQKAQYGRRAPRAWQVGIGTATPGELGQLMGLMHGLYGPPPWTYVGPWAQVTNLLTPAASVLEPGSSWFSPGGAVQSTVPVELDNGARPLSSLVSSSGGGTYTAPFPVIPGIPVTASVWAKGDVAYSLAIAYIDASGAYFSRSPERSFPAPVGGPLVRRSVTSTPPIGAVEARLLMNGAVRMAQPAATWTPDMGAWSVGGGAPKVAARGLSEAVQLAVREQSFLRRSSASFVLEEVGIA